MNSVVRALRPAARLQLLSAVLFVAADVAVKGDSGPRVAPIADQILTKSVESNYVPFIIEQPSPGTIVRASVPDRYIDRVTAQAAYGLTNGYVMIRRDVVQIPFPPAVTVPITLTVTRPAAFSPDHIATTNRTSFQVTYLPSDLNSQYLTVPVGSRFATTAFSAVADLTGDGNPELITLDSEPGRITAAYLDQSALTTVTPRDLGRPISTGTFRGFDVADYNGDGLVDLLTIDGNNQLVLHSQKQTIDKTLTPSFTPATNALPAMKAANTVWADLDNDGLPDLVVVAPGSGSATSPTYSAPRVFWNRGADGFSEDTNSAKLPAAGGPVVAADFDGDGLMDLFVTNVPASGGTGAELTGVLMLNRGDGTFSRSPIAFPNGRVVSAGWTDLNGDGVPDLWTATKLPDSINGELRLLEQRSGTFVQTAAIPLEASRGAITPRGYAVAFGDFDNDGFVDFIAPSRVVTLKPASGASLIPSTNSLLAVWHNDGHGRFTPRSALEDPAAPGNFATLAAADFDGDGSLDLFKGGSTLGSPGVAINQAAIPNLPPTPPVNLSATLLGNWVFLAWKPGTDANQTAPLSYNIRVGTYPGGNDLAPSLSHPNGTRMVPAPGNAGFRTFHLLDLTHADATAIYWSVQSVDAAFQGSVFAAEAVLNLTSKRFTAPQLLGLGNLEIPTNAPTSVRFHVSDDNTRAGALTVKASSSDFLLLDLTALRVANAATFSDPGLRVLNLEPLPGATGIATVTVTVTNRHGLAASQTIRVGIPSLTGTAATGTDSVPRDLPESLPIPTVGPSTTAVNVDASAILGGPRWNDGLWTLWLNAQDGVPRQLQQSGDLLNWQPSSTDGVQTNGRVEFRLAPSDASRTLFFRAIPRTQ